MFNDNVVILFIVLDFELVEESVSWFTNHHGGEKLAAEPCTTAGADGLFDNGYTDGRVFTEFVSAGETGGTGTYDDNVGVSVGYHVGHVTTCHFTRDYGFFDGLEFEGLEIVRGCVEGHGDRVVLLGGGGFDVCRGASSNDGFSME